MGSPLAAIEGEATMPEPKLRVQLIADGPTIASIMTVAPEGSVAPHALSGTDQRLGMAEVAAVVAIVQGSLEIAKLIVEAFQHAERKTSITVRTPKGAVTIKADAAVSVPHVLQALEEAGIL